MPRGRKPSYSWPPRRPSKPSPSPTAGASFLTPSTLHYLCKCSSQRHEAGNGPSDAGAQNCHDRVDRMEEGSVLRRPTSETTNSLSVSDRVRSILGIFSGGGRRVLETLGFERSLSRLVRRCVPRAPSLTTTLGPLG